MLIENNISEENFGVIDICKAVNLERTQVYRKLKALTGKSPSELIKFSRINKAKTLLEQEQMSIKEVAYACGFKDPSYFSKVFKKETSFSPSEVFKKS